VPRTDNGKTQSKNDEHTSQDAMNIDISQQRREKSAGDDTLHDQKPDGVQTESDQRIQFLIHFIVPISAAKAEPERPASMIAATSGPNSRTIHQADKVRHENLRPQTWAIGWADSKAMTSPPIH